ncbi:MAG: tRNA (N(6)-L-threonylcarbamoyladenosine(37)-C(2))-methylthiotransferase MtaB [Oscillospiraceae bacterium]|nr:tRNA (N(6)-L-threonylcarbamoyladenosine(37)-C(2))-methylthiotransferase MtaB [Oscillospiraceae bacterium]
MNVFFYTFGCKVNSFESAAMAGMLRARGYAPAESEADADVVVVNSCTVTANTDRKVRQYLRRVRRENPNAVTVLTGCYASAFPDEAAAMEDADIVTGAADRRALADLLDDYFASRRRVVSVADPACAAFEPLFAPELDGHTRAFLKIEDGCERYCTYCIIPYARGRVRSMEPDELARQVRALADNGYREIVLSGINLSAYGKGTPNDLADAVRIACAPDGVERVRLGSLEPDLLPDALLARLAAEPKLCPQFHLSLQSGCDATLRRMNRHYTAAQYAAVAGRLRALFPRATFTTDVIVGFPGETEGDFADSLAFVRDFGFLKVHVFPYSVRPGTAAARMDGKVPRAEKERRSRAMVAAAAAGRAAVLRSFLGQDVRVILEQPVGGGVFDGYTDEYLPARVSGAGLRGGGIARGTVRDVCGDAVVLEVPAGRE